jgi:type I restriction enzyme, S subunit
MIDINNIPKHWEVKKLGELLDYYIGGDWGKDLSFKDDDFEEVYCVRGSEIRDWDNHKGKVSLKRKVSKSSIEKRALKIGDILVEISGGGPEQPVGRTVLIEKEFIEFDKKTQKVCTNFLRLTRPSSIVNSFYLNFYLNLFYFSGEIVNYQGGSNNLRNLKFNDFLGIDIPLPLLHEQQQIVTKIETLFAEIENGKQKLLTAKQELENYKQSLLKAAFEGRLTNKNVKDGELPKRWEILELGNIIEKIEAGKSFKCDERPPKINEVGVLKLSAITWQIYDEEESKTVLDNKKINTNFLVEKGDFLMSRANTLELIGAVVLVENVTKNLMLSDKTLRLIFKKGISKEFILFYLRSKTGRKEIESLSSGNQVSMRNIGQTKIKQIRFPYCSFEEQIKVVKELETKFFATKTLASTIEQGLQQAETLKQSILQQAFEGKLVKAQVKVAEMFKPKNEYFYQCQILGTIIRASNTNNIQHGEMTLAKVAYLIDRVYQIPTYYQYRQWHLGPYAPAMKKAINKKDFFTTRGNSISLAAGNKLFNYDNPNIISTENAINELSQLILKYDAKDRPHKIELLATVCKVVEDAKSTTLPTVREVMKSWKIDLKTTSFKNKAEKFTEEETKKCLEFIISKGWDKNLMK